MLLRKTNLWMTSGILLTSLLTACSSRETEETLGEESPKQAVNMSALSNNASIRTSRMGTLICAGNVSNWDDLMREVAEKNKAELKSVMNGLFGIDGPALDSIIENKVEEKRKEFPELGYGELLNQAIISIINSIGQAEYQRMLWQVRSQETLDTPEDTNFMKNQLDNLFTLWDYSPLRFNDYMFPVKYVPTFSGLAGLEFPNDDHSQDFVLYYGMDTYNRLKAMGGNNVANAFLLAHEFGHVLQKKYHTLDVYADGETRARLRELTADVFAGYYLGHSRGFNITQQQYNIAYNYVGTIGVDESANISTVQVPDHGTHSQRKAAFQLGYLLSLKDESLTGRAIIGLSIYFYRNLTNGSEINMELINSCPPLIMREP